MARMRCPRCHAVRYWTPNCSPNFTALMPLDEARIRYIARYQTCSGRCVPCIGVPAVTLNCLPQGRHRQNPARPSTGIASLMLPQRSHTGPSGQRTLSRCARQASSVANFRMKERSFIGL